MECKCGGNLKRIAADCYECEICGLKQKVAFMELPKTDIKLNNIDIIEYGNNPTINIIRAIEKEIYKNFGVNRELLNNKR